jgi:hypothetical protein
MGSYIKTHGTRQEFSGIRQGKRVLEGIIMMMMMMMILGAGIHSLTNDFGLF